MPTEWQQKQMNAYCEKERVERHRCLKDWTQANACNELDSDSEVENTSTEEKKRPTDRRRTYQTNIAYRRLSGAAADLTPIWSRRGSDGCRWGLRTIFNVTKVGRRLLVVTVTKIEPTLDRISKTWSSRIAWA